MSWASPRFCAGSNRAIGRPPCFLPPIPLYCTHAHTDRRRRCRHTSLLAAADVSCGQSGRACAAIKIGGGVVALAVAAFTGVKGELAVAIPLGIFGAGLLGWSPFGTSGFRQYRRVVWRRGAQRSAGQKSRVRSQFLDMTLDHDSGELSGQIVAGPYAGHSLGEFDLRAADGDDAGLRRRKRRR